MMKELWRQVDGLLRGRETFSSAEALGKVRAQHLLAMVLVLAVADVKTGGNRRSSQE